MSGVKRTSTIIGLIGVGVVAVAALLLLFFYDPEHVPIYPRCPSVLFTGYQCAGCGSLRGIHALLHGEMLRAWHFNSALFVGIPLILFLLLIGQLRYRHWWAERLYRSCNSLLFTTLLLIGIVAWSILRNL